MAAGALCTKTAVGTPARRERTPGRQVVPAHDRRRALRHQLDRRVDVIITGDDRRRKVVIGNAGPDLLDAIAGKAGIVDQSLRIGGIGVARYRRPGSSVRSILGVFEACRDVV